MNTRNAVTRKLNPALDALVRKFCKRTTRHEPQVLRQIVQLFFADGFDLADQRLKTGTWEAHNTEQPPITKPDMAGWTPEEQAEWYVTGNKPERITKKKRRGGAA